MKKEDKTYIDYLKTLKKKDLTTILQTYQIAYKTNAKVDSLSNLINDNLSKIADFVVNIFQRDEYLNMKYIINKKGFVKIRMNFLLKNFLDILSKNYLIIKKNEKEYQMPNDLLKAFKNKLSNKKTLNIINENTEEYNLILGFTDAYGAVNFDYFYKVYSNKYNKDKDKVRERLEFLANFYGEYKILKSSNVTYICSNAIKNVTELKKYFDTNEYKEYTCEQLKDIHSFKYMYKFRSYKKLNKFIDRHYFVEKNSYKIINKNVIIPYLNMKQLNEKRASELLDKLIDEYFEFKNVKHKTKFIKLIDNVSNDYPKWELKGHSERNKNVKK